LATAEAFVAIFFIDYPQKPSIMALLL